MEAQNAAVVEPLIEAPRREVEYPSSDGVVFAETAWHATAKIHAQSALERYFLDRSSVLVGCDMLMFYRRDDSQASLAPDVYVAFGVGSHLRDNYKVWEEGKPPDFVLEIVSRKTRKNDLKAKPVVYAGIGVQEYWLLDPKRLLREELLAGSRLIGGGYKPITPVESADGYARIPSEALGLHLGTKQLGNAPVVEFWDPESGCEVLAGRDLSRAYASSQKMLLDERAKRIQAEERADRLAARVAELTKHDESKS